MMILYLFYYCMNERKRNRPLDDKYPIVCSPRDEFDFSKFYAKSDEMFDSARIEMTAGCKRTHWIWYILPQLACIGISDTSKFFGIKSLTEATAFLLDPILGDRLIQISTLCLQHLRNDVKIRHLMGSKIDVVKLLSCITLFKYASKDTEYHSHFNELLVLCKSSSKRSICRITKEFCLISIDYTLKHKKIKREQLLCRFGNISKDITIPGEVSDVIRNS